MNKAKLFYGKSYIFEFFFFGMKNNYIMNFVSHNKQYNYLLMNYV